MASALAGASAHAACAPRGIEADIKRWSRATVTAAGDGVIVPGLGTVIDLDCVQGLSEQAAAQRLSRLEASLNFAADQADACTTAYHLPDPTNIRPTLQHLRVHCRPLDGGYEGWTQWGVSHGWDPAHRLFGPFQTTAHYDHGYQTTLNVGPGSALDAGNITDEGAVIFHEMLHFYDNQNDWHNEWGSKTFARQSTGCTNSAFSDRIYFLQSVCFPMGGAGGQFFHDGHWNGAAGCDNVCNEALGNEPDRATREDAADFYGGDAALAHPLTPGDRHVICGRIHSRYDRLEGIITETRHVEELSARVQSQLPTSFRNSLAGAFLHDIPRFFPLQGTLRARSREDALARFRAFRADAEDRIDRACAPGASGDGIDATDRSDLCITKRIQIRGLLDHVATLMLQADDVDYLTHRRAQDPSAITSPGVTP